jgi:GH25 family lysozyme M1 (1,4-beta-N-acetylmuramidase)
MGIIFNNFKIRGIDISEFNGSIEWEKVLAKACHFSGIRVGYGRRPDAQFKINWENSRGKTIRMPYWYMDYYSNHNESSPVNGMPDAAWGKEQAETCWGLIKDDLDDTTIVFLDIESGAPSYSPPIHTVTNRAQTIANNFLTRIDELSGRKNGIYCSMGLLSWFGKVLETAPFGSHGTTKTKLEKVY